MTLTPKLNRELTINDLSSISSGCNDENIIQEIGKLKKSINIQKKEKDRIKRQIETIQNDIECAQNAREIANANAIAIAKRLCALFGEKLNQEQIYNKISELQERVLKSRNEVLEMEEKLKDAKNDAKESRSNAKSMNKTLKDQIKEISIKTNEALAKTEQKVDKIEVIKAQLEKEKDSIENIQNKMEEITKSNDLNITSILNKISANSEDKFASILLNGVDELDKDSLDKLCYKTAERITNCRTKIKSCENCGILRDEIVKNKSKLAKLNQKIDSLKMNEPKMQALIMESKLNKTNEVATLLKKEQKARTLKMRESLKSACETVNYNWIIPSSHKDLCSMYCMFVDQIKHEVQCDKNENENPNSYQGKINFKIKYLKGQNRCITNYLRKH